MRLKILSWNIWYNGDLPKVNEFLENYDADIIGLQEVMRKGESVLLSKRFTDGLGYKYIYAPAVQVQKNGQTVEVGNAIFSKYLIVKSSIHNLSETNNRVAVKAEIQVGGKVLNIFDTHLLHVHQKSSEIQDLQAQNLVKILPKENTILMGDFNALPNSNVIRIISKILNNTDPRLLPTWSVYPSGCIDKTCVPQSVKFKLDNIFTSKDLINHSFKVESSKASDHLPISVVIEI